MSACSPTMSAPRQDMSSVSGRRCSRCSIIVRRLQGLLSSKPGDALRAPSGIWPQPILRASLDMFSMTCQSGDIRMETACETLHKPLPRKRHGRSRKRRDERPAPCRRHAAPAKVRRSPDFSGLRGRSGCCWSVEFDADDGVQLDRVRRDPVLAVRKIEKTEPSHSHRF